MIRQIYLIRHGETTWSITGQHTGRTDLALTENGVQHVRHLGRLLQKKKFDHVLSSPLQRARQTCELAGFGSRARIVPDLREWDYGDYEGRTTAEIHKERPGWNVYLDGCPNGESAEDVSHRADRVLAELRGLEGTAVLFSHGQFLRAVAVRWLDLPVREGQHFGLDTGSLSILGFARYNVEVPVVSLWNVAPNDLFDLAPR